MHRTRKQTDSDVMNTVSGTNGITGSADSAWVLSRPNRGAADATLSITGRDVQFQELKLRFKDCVWELVGKTSEEELEERDIPDCVMRTLDFMSRGVSIWQGTMSNLMEAAGIDGLTVPGSRAGQTPSAEQRLHALQGRALRQEAHQRGPADNASAHAR